MKEDVRRGKDVRRDLDSKRKKNAVPKPNRPFKNFIRPFGLISRRHFPLFPLIPRRCRSCFLPLRWWRVEGEQLNFDSAAIRVPAGWFRRAHILFTGAENFCRGL